MKTNQERALEAIDFCLSVARKMHLPDKDHAIWSVGTSEKPRITLDILETCRAALTQKQPQWQDISTARKIKNGFIRFYSFKGYVYGYGNKYRIERAYKEDRIMGNRVCTHYIDVPEIPSYTADEVKP